MNTRLAACEQLVGLRDRALPILQRRKRDRVCAHGQPRQKPPRLILSSIASKPVATNISPAAWRSRQYSRWARSAHDARQSESPSLVNPAEIRAALLGV